MPKWVAWVLAAAVLAGIGGYILASQQDDGAYHCIADGPNGVVCR